MVKVICPIMQKTSFDMHRRCVDLFSVMEASAVNVQMYFCFVEYFFLYITVKSKLEVETGLSMWLILIIFDLSPGSSVLIPERAQS